MWHRRLLSLYHNSLLLSLLILIRILWLMERPAFNLAPSASYWFTYQIRHIRNRTITNIWKFSNKLAAAAKRILTHYDYDGSVSVTHSALLYNGLYNASDVSNMLWFRYYREYLALIHLLEFIQLHDFMTHAMFWCWAMWEAKNMHT